MFEIKDPRTQITWILWTAEHKFRWAVSPFGTGSPLRSR
jgi:hypothetical protein